MSYISPYPPLALIGSLKSTSKQSCSLTLSLSLSCFVCAFLEECSLIPFSPSQLKLQWHDVLQMQTSGIRVLLLLWEQRSIRGEQEVDEEEQVQLVVRRSALAGISVKSHQHPSNGNSHIQPHHTTLRSNQKRTKKENQ